MCLLNESNSNSIYKIVDIMFDHVDSKNQNSHMCIPQTSSILKSRNFFDFFLKIDLFEYIKFIHKKKKKLRGIFFGRFVKFSLDIISNLFNRTIDIMFSTEFGSIFIWI